MDYFPWVSCEQSLQCFQGIQVEKFQMFQINVLHTVGKSVPVFGLFAVPDQGEYGPEDFIIRFFSIC